jgi:hypothetical protein
MSCDNDNMKNIPIKNLPGEKSLHSYPYSFCRINHLVHLKSIDEVFKWNGQSVRVVKNTDVLKSPIERVYRFAIENCPRKDEACNVLHLVKTNLSALSFFKGVPDQTGLYLPRDFSILDLRASNYSPAVFTNTIESVPEKILEALASRALLAKSFGQVANILPKPELAMAAAAQAALPSVLGALRNYLVASDCREGYQVCDLFKGVVAEVLNEQKDLKAEVDLIFDSLQSLNGAEGPAAGEYGSFEISRLGAIAKVVLDIDEWAAAALVLKDRDFKSVENLKAPLELIKKFYNEGSPYIEIDREASSSPGQEEDWTDEHTKNAHEKAEEGKKVFYSIVHVSAAYQALKAARYFPNENIQTAKAHIAIWRTSKEFKAISAAIVDEIRGSLNTITSFLKKREQE